MIGYNHNRPHIDFITQITLLQDRGLKPIAVTQLYMEDTYIFKTAQEATNAYNLLEKTEKKLCGWFYGFDDFFNTLREYQTESNNCVLIHWIEQGIEKIRIDNYQLQFSRKLIVAKEEELEKKYISLLCEELDKNPYLTYKIYYFTHINTDYWIYVDNKELYDSEKFIDYCNEKMDLFDELDISILFTNDASVIKNLKLKEYEI